jgi:hypothetical protein
MELSPKSPKTVRFIRPVFFGCFFGQSNIRKNRGIELDEKQSNII